MTHAEADDDVQVLLEARIEQEIELMLDPLEFENAYEQPMIFDLFDENGQEIMGNLQNDQPSSVFCLRSHSAVESQFPRYFDVTAQTIPQHDVIRKNISNHNSYY